MVWFTASELVADAPCVVTGAGDWRLVGCVSSQADDGPAGEDPYDDCVVAADGLSLCVRAKRKGKMQEARRYSVLAAAPGSEPEAVGEIVVPHDRRLDDACQAGR